MKTSKFFSVAATIIVTCFSFLAQGQGTIVFNGQTDPHGTNYYEQGIWFHVVIPGGSTSYDSMVITQGAGNTPQNGTPFMGWFRQFNPYNYVSLSTTDGSLFGLSSVDLADPTAPSYSLLPITFVGFRADGSTVSQTFTTPGGGANSFLTYQFGSDFASGLLSVQIDASRWAMDNLVFVIPEPGTSALLGLGLLAIAARQFHRRRRL